MQKGALELRRAIGARNEARIVYLDSTEYGARLGLSVEPGLQNVPGPDGRVLHGYIVGDHNEATKIVGKARKARVWASVHEIPKVPRLASRLQRGDVEMDPREARILGRVISSYLDVATTGMSRATHYNSREEQESAERMAHATMMRVDRQTYGLLSCLPGLTDNARKLAAWALLDWPSIGQPTQQELTRERRLVEYLTQHVTPPRMFQLFALLDEAKCNNQRTRRVILQVLLGSDKLVWWAVKYRRKFARALQHAWGKRRASIIREIAGKSAHTTKETAILREHVYRYTDLNRDEVLECMAFVLGTPGIVYRQGLLRAFEEAKHDLRKGRTLPPEVLEGIRAQYHPGKSHDDVLRLTAKAGSHTDGQRLKGQRRAERAGADLRFDPKRFDAVKLYIYAFERGMTDDIVGALTLKARQAAAQMPLDCEGAVVLLDASKSMEGSGDQKLRPIAAALALSDALEAAGARRIVVGGTATTDALVRPGGDTSLAQALVQALREDATAVYCISDGYDNTPAGRFAEVVQAVRRLGISVPIYHLNPVAAAEVGAVRQLAPDLVPTVAVQDPKAFATSMLRQTLEQDPLRGLKALLGQARRALQAPAPRAVRGPAPSPEVLDITKELSVAMKTALTDLYTERPDTRGRVQYRGRVGQQTVQALKRRGLVRQVSKQYCYRTERGQEVANALLRV